MSTDIVSELEKLFFEKLRLIRLSLSQKNYTHLEEIQFFKSVDDFYSGQWNFLTKGEKCARYQFIQSIGFQRKNDLLPGLALEGFFSFESSEFVGYSLHKLIDYYCIN